ncbi:MAG: hypothetical protein AB9866_13815 [Syntrophobacteraceae bacterium]
MDNIDDLFVSTCRTMIRTVLCCLDNATKGTIYKIGLAPELRAVRIMSGLKQDCLGDIEWGLPEGSDYNHPGKTWEQYRDEPGRAMEAMGWCVEKQTSWTAENPFEDARSIRKQLAGEPEDFYHMEPVLVSKKNLYGRSIERIRYPVDWKGEPIWQDTEYIVAAIIKIHFRSGTLSRGDRSTSIIKGLSTSLGSELLSLWLRETLHHARKDFARQRLQSCEILAHELRNTLVKLGFVFSAINAQIAILRESWEQLLQANVPGLEWKGAVLDELCQVLGEKSINMQVSSELLELRQNLLLEQKQLAKLSLSPFQEQEWIRNRIYPKWDKLLSSTLLWDRTEISSLLNRLSNALRTGMNVDVQQIEGFPCDLITQWSKLAYVQITSSNLSQMDEIIRLVEHPALPVCHKQQILRVLKSLKALVHTIPEVEEKAGKILQSLRHGTWAEDQYWSEPEHPDLDSSGEFGAALTD